MRGARPAFVRGAKLLLMVKLVGEPSYGIHERRFDQIGRRSFVVQRVDRLPPADRAGLMQGDELLTVQVLGVDKDAYVWTDLALERLEGLEEINMIQLWVKKVRGTQITDGQEKHRDRISQMLRRAREYNVSRTHCQRPFIRRQLRKIVVGIYDKEMEYFGSLWKALTPEQRVGITLSVARDFVNTNRLPALLPRHQIPPVAPVAGRAPAATAADEVQRAPASPTETDVDTTYSLPTSSRPPSPHMKHLGEQGNDIDELIHLTNDSDEDTSSLDESESFTRNEEPFQRQRPKLTTERTKRGARLHSPHRGEGEEAADSIDLTEGTEEYGPRFKGEPSY